VPDSGESLTIPSGYTGSAEIGGVLIWAPAVLALLSNWCQSKTGHQAQRIRGNSFALTEGASDSWFSRINPIQVVDDGRTASRRFVNGRAIGNTENYLNTVKLICHQTFFNLRGQETKVMPPHQRQITREKKISEGRVRGRKCDSFFANSRLLVNGIRSAYVNQVNFRLYPNSDGETLADIGGAHDERYSDFGYRFSFGRQGTVHFWGRWKATAFR
jgi:hypothetical protein